MSPSQLSTYLRSFLYLPLLTHTQLQKGRTGPVEKIWLTSAEEMRVMSCTMSWWEEVMVSLISKREDGCTYSHQGSQGMTRAADTQGLRSPLVALFWGFHIFTDHFPTATKTHLPDHSSSTAPHQTPNTVNMLFLCALWIHIHPPWCTCGASLSLVHGSHTWLTPSASPPCLSCFLHELLPSLASAYVPLLDPLST